MGRRVVAVGVALVPVLVLLTAACGGRSAADAAKCLRGKSLLVEEGILYVPKGMLATGGNVATGEVKTNSRPRRIPKLDVLGLDNIAMVANHAVIVFPRSQDEGMEIQAAMGIGFPPKPPSWPTGDNLYISAYYDRNVFIVWDASPTKAETNLIEGCLR
jgi:hypothetical protein